jgi:DNA-binding XRE family transcriptional regulator
MSGFATERSFGALLRTARLDAALTQQDLATRCGMSVRAISDLERNRTRRPYLRSVRLLAEALNVPRPLRDAMLAASRCGGRDGHPADEARCVAGDQPGGHADPRAPGAPDQVGAAASAWPADQLPGVVMDFAGLAEMISSLTNLAAPVAVQVSIPLVLGGRPGTPTTNPAPGGRMSAWLPFPRTCGGAQGMPVMDGGPGRPTVCQISSAALWHEMRAQAELLAAVAEQLFEAVAKTAALAEALTDLRPVPAGWNETSKPPGPS